MYIYIYIYIYIHSHGKRQGRDGILTASDGEQPRAVWLTRTIVWNHFHVYCSISWYIHWCCYMLQGFLLYQRISYQLVQRTPLYCVRSSQSGDRLPRGCAVRTARESAAHPRRGRRWARSYSKNSSGSYSIKSSSSSYSINSSSSYYINKLFY